MNNTVETSKKVICEMSNEIEDTLIEVGTLPDLFQVFIENYGIDMRELTEAQRYDLGNAGGKLYNLLTLAQRIIWTLEEKQERIVSRYIKSSESTATTTETTK